MAESPENKGSGGGGEVEEPLTRDDADKSSPDLGSLAPGAFYDGLKQRVASDPNGVRTRRWLDEAKNRLRQRLGAVGLQIESFAFSMRGGKPGIWLTFLRKHWVSKRGQHPSWLEAEEQGDGDFVQVRVVGDMAVDEEKNRVDEEIKRRMAAVSAELAAIAELLKSRRDDAEKKSAGTKSPAATGVPAGPR